MSGVNASLECDGPPTRAAPPEPVIRLTPPARDWPALTAPALTPEHRRFREQLGLPTDRPVIMSGHQVGFWHAGILAKLLAANALAARTGAAVAWVLIDHASPHPDVIRVPALDREGRLREHAWRVSPGLASGLAGAAPFEPSPLRPPAGWTLPPGIAERCERVVRALQHHRGAFDAAAQLTRALFDLLEPVTPAPVVIRATKISRTDLYLAVLERAAKRPQGLRSLYNDAAAMHPASGVRALADDPELGAELPFWRRDGSVYLSLHERDLGAVPPEQTAPRALLTTGLVRLAGCELFVHGDGGLGYEPINDRWLPRWLDPADPPRLAPFVGASADLTLDLGAASASEREAAGARWRAHHARHHPGATGDERAQRARDELVRAIDALPRRSPERRARFAELHRLLADHEMKHAADLDALDREAAGLARLAAERLPREDRTWSVVLHESTRLRALGGRIGHAFGGV